MATLLRLSLKAGINLDHIVTWTEDTTSVPETTQTPAGPETHWLDVPCIRVTCTQGEYTYTGVERAALLAAITIRGLLLP
jgi:hypothetical protein